MGRQSDARERLIESAGELWHARSYGDVGVSEICTHAGVQKGSFYHFFSSKRDLALAVIDMNWQARGVGEMGPALSSDRPPLQRLIAIMDQGLEHQRQMKAECGSVGGCHFGNLVVEMSNQDEVLRERLSRLFCDWSRMMRPVLDEAVAAGDLPATTDTEVASRALLAYMEGLAVLVKAENDPDAVKDLIPQALRLLGVDPATLDLAATPVAR